MSSETTHPHIVRRMSVLGIGRTLAFAVTPVVVAYGFLSWQHSLGVIGFDFEGTLWSPAEAILAGVSPYPAPEPGAISTGHPAVYPPAVMLLIAPLTALPWTAGLAVWIVLSFAAAAGALWLLDVRDWRVYGIALATMPLLFGITYGNITMVLLLGLAAAWRWRHRTWPCAVAVAALIVLKLFLWPLVVWLVVTRRFRAAALSVTLAAATLMLSWAAIGFDGLGDYPDLLRAVDAVYSEKTLSLTALLIGTGLGSAVAKSLAAAAGLGVLVLGLALARRTDGDRRMFTAAIVAAILVTPVAWIYYYVLLLVPIALIARAFAPVWLLPLAFWLDMFLLPLFFLLVPFVSAPAFKKPPCCAPEGMPEVVWRTLSTDQAFAPLVINACLLAWVAWVTLRAEPSDRSAR